jgi:hypothetical protein
MSSIFAPITFLKKSIPLPTIGLLAVLAACAAMPQAPTDAITAADNSIKQAEEARVADYASAEIRSAREKVAQARVLTEQGTREKDAKAMQQARRLAEESRSDADLAIAKAQLVRAESVNKEMLKNNETLQHEIQRKTGS